jgi:hypothetical protein
MLDTPAPANPVPLLRPLCSKCGSLTGLARIEPSDRPGYDLRTFECAACGNIETMLVKFR